VIGFAGKIKELLGNGLGYTCKASKDQEMRTKETIPLFAFTLSFNHYTASKELGDRQELLYRVYEAV